MYKLHQIRLVHSSLGVVSLTTIENAVVAACYYITIMHTLKEYWALVCVTLILNLLCARTGVHRLPLVQFAQFLVEHNCLFFYLLGTAPPPRVEELQPLLVIY